MHIFVNVFADKDFEYCVDSFKIVNNQVDVAEIIKEAKKRFGDTYSGLNITIREES